MQMLLIFINIRYIIVTSITYIINKYLKENKFSENYKTALVRPIYKKDDRDKIKNYRPVSLSNGFFQTS